MAQIVVFILSVRDKNKTNRQKEITSFGTRNSLETKLSLEKSTHQT